MTSAIAGIAMPKSAKLENPQFCDANLGKIGKSAILPY